MNRREFAALAGAGVAGYFFPRKSHGEPSFSDVGVVRTYDVMPKMVSPEGMAVLIAEFPQGPESLLFYDDDIGRGGRPLPVGLRSGSHRTLIPPPAGCFGRHVAIELHECAARIVDPIGRDERFRHSTWSVAGTTLHVESPNWRTGNQLWPISSTLIRWVVDLGCLDAVRFKRVNQPMVSYQNLGEVYQEIGPVWCRVIDGRFERTVFQFPSHIDKVDRALGIPIPRKNP